MDFIELFIHATRHLPSCERYRRWTAIGLIGASLERRCWTNFVAGALYPNMYILLVGGPASGKTIPIAKAHDLLAGLDLRMAPDSATKASFLDCLESALVVRESAGETLEYSAVSVINDEFGNFIKEYDHVFLNVLNRIYDGRSSHEDTVRHGGFSVSIQRPLVTMLAGTQPDYLGLIMPDSAWNTGFMTRTVMVYSGDCITKNDLWASAPEESADWQRLQGHLRELTKWAGQFRWAPDARAAVLSWRSADCPPAPEHPRLRYYNSRRPFFAIKMAMCRAAGQGRLDVTLEDWSQARDWLCEAEQCITGVFDVMTVAGSDKGVIDDLVMQVRKAYAGHPLSEGALAKMIVGRVPVERIERIIKAACSMGYLKCLDTFTKTYAPSEPAEPAPR